jgi:hypothetical protein
MKFFLKCVIPALAVAVLVLCLVAAFLDKGVMKISEAFQGGISTYFIAKGVFCSAALFLLGKLTERLAYK